MTNFNRIKQTALTNAFTFMAFGGVAHANDGYRRATGFEQIKSECEFFACEFFADQAVFAAGNRVGWVVQPMYHARAFDQCMMAKGYARDQ